MERGKREVEQRADIKILANPPFRLSQVLPSACFSRGGKKRTCFQQVKLQPDSPSLTLSSSDKERGKALGRARWAGGTGAEKEGRGWSEGEEGEGGDYDCH